MEMDMATIVLKGISVELRKRLEERARSNGRSVGAEVIACLEEWIGPGQVPVVDVEKELAGIRTFRTSIAAGTSHRLTDREIDRAKRKGRP
jgi:plasmid stability protein